MDVAAGDLAAGFRAYTLNCAGCHQSLARGGRVTGGVAPSLTAATATQIAEAVRIGPYLMPPFSKSEIDGRTLDSIVRYVRWTRHPANEGGWGLGNIGPIPEGLVAWLVAGLGLLLVVHHLLDRPRDAPDRTAVRAAVFAFVAVIFLAGSADRIFVEVGIPYERQIWLFRIAAIVVPAAVFLVTRSVARELRDTGWHPLRGADDRIIRRTGSGGFD